ncbi:MAG TPA: S-layer homology domain-containing protein [Candidatus Fusicatenibacter intestinipullorum]|nr:S-layer homology domain-containing protein [Candidatus Fusicatenibacter intestinipullorum]
MKKSLVLAMAMALGVTASAYAANPFSDVPAGHWAYDAVNKLAAEGVVDGYPDGTYGGDKLMTRYEMAQIVAKAMAKGANVDKLAAEFADELDSLGVRVANLEKKADNVKVTGEIRYSYRDVDGDVNGNESVLRSRLWVNGQINEDWSYTGMFENNQDFGNETGDDEIDFARAYVEGRVGGLDVVAGRYNEVTFSGNILDANLDMAKVSYGDKIKVSAAAGKAYDSVEVDEEAGKLLDSDDRIYIGSIEAALGDVDAYVAYFKTNSDMDKEIWNVGASYGFGDFTLSAEYMRGDKEYYNAGKDGWWADLAWKGAEADQPGSYGIHAGYYDQSPSAYIMPTTDAEYFADGYKGWNVGVSYTFAKNIVGMVNYWDMESQTTNEDAQTIFSELYFMF